MNPDLPQLGRAVGAECLHRQHLPHCEGAAGRTLEAAQGRMITSKLPCALLGSQRAHRSRVAHHHPTRLRKNFAPGFARVELLVENSGSSNVVNHYDRHYQARRKSVWRQHRSCRQGIHKVAKTTFDTAGATDKSGSSPCEVGWRHRAWFASRERQRSDSTRIGNAVDIVLWPDALRIEESHGVDSERVAQQAAQSWLHRVHNWPYSRRRSSKARGKIYSWPVPMLPTI